MKLVLLTLSLISSLALAGQDRGGTPIDPSNPGENQIFITRLSGQDRGGDLPLRPCGHIEDEWQRHCTMRIANLDSVTESNSVFSDGTYASASQNNQCGVEAWYKSGSNSLMINSFCSGERDEFICRGNLCVSLADHQTAVEILTDRLFILRGADQAPVIFRQIEP